MEGLWLNKAVGISAWGWNQAMCYEFPASQYPSIGRKVLNQQVFLLWNVHMIVEQFVALQCRLLLVVEHLQMLCVCLLPHLHFQG